MTVDRYRWVLLASLFGIYLGFGVVASSPAPIVGTISTDLGLSRSQMGLVLGIWQFVYLASSVPAGRFLDRVGLRWGLLVGIVLVALSGLLRALAVGWGSLLVAVGVFGLGGPLISIGSPTLVSAWFVGDARGPATGAAAGGPVVGSVITLLSANGVLMPLYDDRWRLVVATYASGCAVSGPVQRQQSHLAEAESFDRFKRNAQVAVVNRIKAAAEQTDRGLAGGVHRRSPRCMSGADMSVSQHDPFLRCEPLQPDRTAGMELVGADANLRAEAVFKAIREAGGRVDHDRA